MAGKGGRHLAAQHGRRQHALLRYAAAVLVEGQVAKGSEMQVVGVAGGAGRCVGWGRVGQDKEQQCVGQGKEEKEQECMVEGETW